jgi:hypothetical protein
MCHCWLNKKWNTASPTHSYERSNSGATTTNSLAYMFIIQSYDKLLEKKFYTKHINSICHIRCPIILFLSTEDYGWNIICYSIMLMLFHCNQFISYRQMLSPLSPVATQESILYFFIYKNHLSFPQQRAGYQLVLSMCSTTFFWNIPGIWLSLSTLAL